MEDKKLQEELTKAYEALHANSKAQSALISRVYSMASHLQSENALFTVVKDDLADVKERLAAAEALYEKDRHVLAARGETIDQLKASSDKAIAANGDRFARIDELLVKLAELSGHQEERNLTLLRALEQNQKLNDDRHTAFLSELENLKGENTQIHKMLEEHKALTGSVYALMDERTQALSKQLVEEEINKTLKKTPKNKPSERDPFSGPGCVVTFVVIWAIFEFVKYLFQHVFQFTK